MNSCLRISAVLCLSVACFFSTLAIDLQQDPRGLTQIPRAIRHRSEPSFKTETMEGRYPIKEGNPLSSPISAALTPFGEPPQLQWQIHSQNALASGQAKAVAIAADSSGAFYVCGWYSTNPFGTAILTAKYSAAGRQLWADRYAGDGDGIPLDVQVTPQGQVIVSGLQSGGSKGVLLWYSADGDLTRQHLFDHPDEQQVSWPIMTLDRFGQLWLAVNTSVGLQLNKFDPSGKLIWQREQLHPDKGLIIARSIRRDHSGSLVLLAYYQLDNGYADFITTKFDSSGTLLWQKRYGEAGTDEPIALAIGPEDRVYVAGWSEYAPNRPFDFVTLAYDQTGALLWNNRYANPDSLSANLRSLTLDRNGHVYVSGECHTREGPMAVQTLSYDQDGRLRWQKRYQDPLQSHFQVIDAVVDRAGSLLVSVDASQSYDYHRIFLVKYDRLGNQVWVASTAASFEEEVIPLAMTIAADDQVAIAGTSKTLLTNSMDLLTLSFDRHGRLLWQQQLSGETTSRDQLIDMAVDVAGQCYVLGRHEVAGSTRTTVFCYTKDGDPFWQCEIDPLLVDTFIPTRISVDHGGNSYVSGTFRDKEGDEKYVTIKITASGTVAWISPLTFGEIQPANIVEQRLDDAGNLWCTAGIYDSRAIGADMLVWKLLPQGRLAWSQRLEVEARSDDSPVALALDVMGNSYVLGIGGLDGDAILAKYDRDGEQQWITRYSMSARSFDSPIGCVLDRQTHLYVLVKSSDATTGPGARAIVLKYDRNGRLLWQKNYGEGDDYFFPHFIELDRKGRVVISGYRYSTNRNRTEFLQKIDADGETCWYREFDARFPADFGLDLSDNSYVLASSMQGESWLIAHNSEGEWLGQWPVAVKAADHLQLDPIGGLFLGGRQSGLGWNIFLLARYQLDGAAFMSPERVALEQNYPNPCNAVTTLRYSIPSACRVRICMFDLLGRQVAELIDSAHLAGTHEVHWDARGVASGLYYVQLTTPMDQMVKKVLVVK